MTDTPQTPPSPISEFSPQQFFSQWWFSLIVITTIIVLASFGNDLSRALSFDTQKINAGEWWRIISAHFVHLSANHTLLNVTGYLILGFGFRNEVSAIEEMSALFVSLLGVSLGLYLFSAGPIWYVGLSGAIYGLLISNVIISLKKTPYLSGFFLFFVVTKILYEQFFSPADQFTEQFIGGPVAIDSHLYGALSGIIPGLAWFIIKNKSAAQSSDM